MTYYIYNKPCGNPYISTELLGNNPITSGYTLIYESEEKPDLRSKRYINGQWVDISPPEYIDQRKMEYPKMSDQLDMLWHAMNDGLLPKAEPFYTSIKTVKDKYPKE